MHVKTHKEWLKSMEKTKDDYIMELSKRGKLLECLNVYDVFGTKDLTLDQVREYVEKLKGEEK